MTDLIVELSELEYVYPEKGTIGYIIQRHNGNELGDCLLVQAHFVDNHYVLEIETNPRSGPFGVSHDEKEARNRIYEVALKEAINMSRKTGYTLVDKTLEKNLALSQ